MIVFLEGEISTLNFDSIVINVNGVGYYVLISKNTYEILLDSKSKKHQILIHHHITDSSQSLFGFIDEEERHLFTKLISESGIGPKTARRIIIELKDEFGQFNKDDLPLENDVPSNDAFSALKNLGFDVQSITKVINSITADNDSINTEEIIKKALKLLK